MNRWQQIGIGLVLAIVLVAGSAMADGLIRLTIPAEVTVTGPQIRLLDLADVSGANAADYQILQKISLGPVPAPGQIRTFSKDYLTFQLRQRQLSQGVQLEMDAVVRVRAAAASISGEAIQAAISSLLTVKPGLTRWIELKNVPETLWLTPGDWKLTAMSVGVLPEIGNALFQVILENGPERKIINISGKIHGRARLYKLSRSLAKPTLLEKADLIPVELELVYGNEYYGEIDGWRSIRSLRAGTVLRLSDIQPVPLIAKGQSVKTIIRVDAVEIVVEGIANADGWLGDQIVIVNPSSKKTFQARVSGPGTAEVIFHE